MFVNKYYKYITIHYKYIIICVKLWQLKAKLMALRIAFHWYKSSLTFYNTNSNHYCESGYNKKKKKKNPLLCRADQSKGGVKTTIQGKVLLCMFPKHGFSTRKTTGM